MMDRNESLGREFAAFISKRCRELKLQPVDALAALSVCSSALICTITNDTDIRENLADGLAFTVKLQNTNQPSSTVQ
jgi:hypothetical protein